MAIFANTTYRVAENTPTNINQKIRSEAKERIRAYVGAGREEIDQRLRELDAEWDIERRLMTNASALMVTGVLLSLTVSRKFIILPGIVGSFLLQHALQGWCPPVSIFRRMGVRTTREIEEERMALKILRGDFDFLEAGNITAEEAIAAVRL